MEKMNEIRALVQIVVDDLYYAEKYCEAYTLKAQKLGLQGEKRRLRYESTNYHNFINYFKCDFYDLYGVDLTAQHVEKAIPTVTSIKDYFYKVLEYSEMLFDKFHSQANSLIMSNARHYAACLYAQCDCLIDYIKQYKRIIAEGDAAGWSDAYVQRLLLYETTALNIHDSFEEKEKSVGYDF